MKTSFNSLSALLAFLATAPSWLIILSAQSYTYDIIATTGQTPVNANGPLTGMGDNPSINSSGAVAFVGQFAAGEGIVVGNNPKPLNLITPSSVRTARFFGRAVQIDDANQVMANDRVSSSPPLSFERIWNGNNQNSFTLVARGGPTYPYDAVFNQGSVNNSQDTAFGALRGTQTLLVSVSGGGANEIPMPTNSLPRPLIADDKSIVIRFGNLPNSPILLFGTDLKTPRAAIAGSASFDVLGNQPGISDDGQVVSFYGNLNTAGAAALETSPGIGIFASVSLGTPQRTLVRIDDGTFSAFSADTRVGVTNLSTVPGTATFTVAFIATPQVGPRGLWTIRVDVTTDPMTGDLEFRLYGATPVVKIGDMIGGQTVTGVTVFDPIANQVTDDKGAPRVQKPGDHRLAFLATTSSGSVIVRATPSVCGDERDQLIMDYIRLGVQDIVHGQKSGPPFLPTCSDFTKDAHNVNFTFNQLNISNMSYPTWALVRQPFASGLDAWISQLGSTRPLNSAYRPPADQFRVYLGLGIVPPKGSRHMFGDAADLDVPSESRDEWRLMVKAAKRVGATFIEPDRPPFPCFKKKAGTAAWRCAHADWQGVLGSYLP